MPYSLIEIGVEPQKALLRRGEILRWIGISKNSFDRVVKEGLLPWKTLVAGGVRVYRKEDVVHRFLKGFRGDE